jgi:hypothetical protein
MGWDGLWAARPDIRRQPDTSNFTATLRTCTLPVSHLSRVTSAIIEGKFQGNYDKWNMTYIFRDLNAVATTELTPPAQVRE